MPGKLLSIILVGSCAIFGGLIGHSLTEAAPWTILSMVLGSVLGLSARAVMGMWAAMEAPRILAAAVGVLAGTIAAVLLYSAMGKHFQSAELGLAVFGLLTVVCVVGGMHIGSAKGEELFSLGVSGDEHRTAIAGILDTSVIIDGRIADVCETGFIQGSLIVPQFVLNELQAIADSAESTKRTRGRRGLDILGKIRKQAHVTISIDSRDYPGIREVDQKLIAMANETGCAILTNDFNLNKVAEVHSIQVLNMNQLSNALKPIVLPGEHMRMQILREGKEPGQGIAYLDDGTMVVVEQGRRYVGKFVDTTVTSVLQTPAGRMIFASIRD